MRLLVVHPRMSIKGGGERVAVHSMLAGIKNGHSVSLVSEQFDTREFEDFFGCPGLFAQVESISYPPFSARLGNRLLLYQRIYYHQRQLRSALSEHRDFDLVVGTQDVGYVPDLKAPLVQYCYFPEYFTHLEQSPSSILWKAYYWPASRFYKNRVRKIDRLLAVSNYTRDFVRTKWGRDSETVYPPCPTQLYSGLHLPKENKVVTIGRIVPEKRMDVFSEIARKLPSVKFVLIGSVGETGSRYFDSLKATAPKNLEFVLSPLRKAMDVMASSKAYVHCALNEHFGITIVEAMSAGCVPVVHDSGGPREIVDKTVGFRWNGVEQAVTQISTLMSDDSLRQALSKNAVAKSSSYDDEAFESSLARIIARY